MDKLERPWLVCTPPSLDTRDKLTSFAVFFNPLRRETMIRFHTIGPKGNKKKQKNISLSIDCALKET